MRTISFSLHRKKRASSYHFTIPKGCSAGSFLRCMSSGLRRRITHTSGLLQPPQAVVRLKARRQLLKRMIRVAVHAHSDNVSAWPDAHRLCFVRVCAAIGAGAAGFPASVDRSMLPFAMLEQLLPHRAGYTSVRMADEATDHALPLHTHGDGRPLKHSDSVPACRHLQMSSGLFFGLFIDFSRDEFCRSSPDHYADLCCTPARASRGLLLLSFLAPSLWQSARTIRLVLK